MHEQILAQAALPEPPRIFRVQLRPYSLGHELHLYRRNSPYLMKSGAEFMQMSRGQRLAMTMQAVSVCSRTFQQNQKPARGWGWWRQVAQWMDLDAAIGAVWDYLRAGRMELESSLPDSTTPGMVVRYLGTPPLLRLYQEVCDTMPHREIAMYGRTAWDYPLGLAKMLQQARDETAGRIQVFNFKDELERKYIAEQEALAASEAKEGVTITPDA